jgi:hypothetical protein
LEISERHEEILLYFAEGKLSFGAADHHSAKRIIIRGNAAIIIPPQADQLSASSIAAFSVS